MKSIGLELKYLFYWVKSLPICWVDERSEFILITREKKLERNTTDRQHCLAERMTCTSDRVQRQGQYSKTNKQDLETFKGHVYPDYENKQF